MVLRRFLGIQNFPYLKLGIRDFKEKSGRGSGFKVSAGGGIPKITLAAELRKCTKFRVGITGLKNPIGNPHVRLLVNLLFRLSKKWINPQKRKRPVIKMPKILILIVSCLLFIIQVWYFFGRKWYSGPYMASLESLELRPWCWIVLNFFVH